MSTPHLYAVLGVTRSSALPEMRSKYRALTRDLHPDRNGGTPEANAKFAEITEAYAVLSDATRKQAYDRKFDLLHDACPACNGTGQSRKQSGFTAVILSVCPNCTGLGRIKTTTGD